MAVAKTLRVVGGEIARRTAGQGLKLNGFEVTTTPIVTKVFAHISSAR